MTTAWMARRIGTLTCLAALAFWAALATGPAARALPAARAGHGDTALDVVILVDESGSLSPADVQHEIEAAGTIAQTPLNPRSRMTVIGFGGADGAVPGQIPTTIVCQPTVTQGVSNLEYLARCVRALHRRTRAEGWNTDYAAALSQAMAVLSPATTAGQQSPAGATKVILLLTDGGLDETGNPQYPQPNWLPGAHHAVDVQLGLARAAGVQVWPLGFGSISGPDARYLRYLASQGAQAASDCPGSAPRAVIAQDSARAQAAFYSLYAAAGCIGTSSGRPTQVPPGQSRTLTVTIPPIASDVAISVDKGNPAISVVYLTPSGAPATGGALGGSTFQQSGQDTAVQVLHVSDPQPGNWRIRLTAPPGSRNQLVSVTAFWQGAVRISLVPAPPNARTGQPVTVTLTVLGPHGPITDPAALRGVHVQVSVQGDGLAGPTAVPMSEAQGTAASGLTAGDYIGRFTAPSTRGTLAFTGTASGYGLHAIPITSQVSVGSLQALLQGTVLFPALAQVTPGQAINGQVFFKNQTGRPVRVRLALSTSAALATVTAPAGAITVPSGTSARDFRITLARGTRIGSASLVVRVIDASHPGISYGAGQILITVSPRPGLLTRYRWEITGAVLLLMVLTALLYLRRQARRRISDVRHLMAILIRHGEQVSTARPPRRRADTFRFTLRDEETGHAYLDRPQPGDHSYAARLAGDGKVALTSPDGAKAELDLGGAGKPLANGFSLVIRDTRHDATHDYPDDEPPGQWADPPIETEAQGAPDSPAGGPADWY